MGKVKDRLSELEAELEKVKEKRVKLEVDDKAVRDAEDRVKNLRSALDQFKSLAETPSEIESAQAAAVREATAKGGYTGTEGADAIIQEIMRAMGDRSLGGEAGRQRQQQIEDAQAAIDEDQAALDALPRHARMAKHQDDLNARQTELNKQKADREEFMKAQEQDAQELVGKAMQGQSEALQRLQEMAKSGTFNDPFAKAIGAADIESQRRQQNVRQLQEARKADLEQERRQQEQAEAERQQTEDAIRAKRDAELLAKVREGQAVAPEAQAGYLREGEKGAEVRRMELEAAQADAKSKADKEAQQARDKANSEAEAERKRQDTEAEANRKAQIAEAMAINQKFVPNIQYAMGTSGGLPTPQLHQAISRDLGRQGIDPAIQNEVAAQLQEQALKDLRQATASKEAMGLNQQQAFAATIMELARQIRQQMIEGQQIRQELDQARGIIRETRQAIRPTGPSHLPYYN